MRVRLSCIQAILLAWLGVVELGCQSVSTHPIRLTGTYLQLWNRHRSWEQPKWTELFGYLRRIGINELVIQWSVYDGRPYYQDTAGASKEAALNAILRMAQRSRMRVWLGLAHDSAYWENIQHGAKKKRAYLQTLRQASLKAARELTGVIGNHPGIQGWYLSEEIDDVNWMSPAARREVITHLGLLTKGLRTLTNEKKVAISGFSSAHASPRQLGAFWYQLLKATGIDVVFFQDGQGTHKLERAKLSAYLASMQSVIQRLGLGRELRVVVEIFRQVDGPPLNDRPFRAVPAAWERIQRQLEIASAFSRSGLVAFSLPEYMTPLGGLRADRLFVQYLKSHSR